MNTEKTLQEKINSLSKREKQIAKMIFEDNMKQKIIAK
jgi:DNA-directed RNA polymerase specialized sigma subunit